MCPIAFKAGSFAVYSKTLMIITAVLVCSFFLIKECRSLNIGLGKLLRLMIWTTVWSMLGARLLALIIYFDHYQLYPQELGLWSARGFSLPGAVIAGTAFSWYFMAKHKMPVLKIWDVAAPYLALGQAIARIGCFLNGCCYGKLFQWGVYFPGLRAVVHPTQLYLMWGSLIIFCILKRFQRKNAADGRVFVLYWILELIMRFFMDFIRVDNQPFWLGLSIYQLICAFLLGGAMYAYSKCNRCA